MTKSKSRISRSLVMVSMLALLLVGSGTPTSSVALAAPTEAVTLNATQDVYTDINAETTNFNDGLLTAANSPGALEEGDVTTKQIFLEFDLSGVQFEIKSATLSLATLICGGLVPVDAVDLAVYGVDNALDWNEAALTWENQPDISTESLATLDAGGTTFNSAQIYTWTDDNQGDFATWLESQRNANDKSATLVLVIENADGPGMADIFFEDREGTGAAYGCADSLGGPTLKVREAAMGYTIFIPLVRR